MQQDVAQVQRGCIVIGNVHLQFKMHLNCPLDLFEYFLKRSKNFMSDSKVKQQHV